MSKSNYVIDATMGCRNGMFVFCPIEGDLEGDYEIVTGLNILSDEPPIGGEVVAIVHEDGQEAVEEFCDEYVDELERLTDKLEERDS